MIYVLLRFLSAVLAKILLRPKVFGRENIPKDGGFIIASNHLSYLDPILLGIACPRKLNYMAKKDLFDNPLFGWLLRKIKVFPVRRKSADLSSIKEAIRRLERGEGLLLFPEGTRTSDGKHAKPLGGVGFLASKAFVPVIPAFVKGTEKALPKGASFIKPVRVSICFGKQISIERRLPYDTIARNIMQSVRQLSCQVSS